MKKRKNGPAAFVQVGVGTVSTSVSINRHGFDKAWAKAAALYAPLVGRPLLEIIEAKPAGEQLVSLIHHFNMEN